VVPRLLDLMGHSASMQVIPEAIARALNVFWGDQNMGPHEGVVGDITEGAKRRALGSAMMQPDDTHQSVTDTAARELSQHLNHLAALLMSIYVWPARFCQGWARFQPRRNLDLE
jgi:hypothetical protein